MKLVGIVTYLVTVAIFSCLTRLSYCSKEEGISFQSPPPSFEDTSHDEDESSSEIFLPSGHRRRNFFTETRPFSLNSETNPSISTGNDYPIIQNNVKFLGSIYQQSQKGSLSSKETGRFQSNEWEENSSISHEAMFKYFIKNHLVALTPCTNYEQRPINGSALGVITNKSSSEGYCTSPSTCLNQVVSSWPLRDQSTLATLQRFVVEGSNLLRPTCLYLENGALHNGICCKSTSSTPDSAQKHFSSQSFDTAKTEKKLINRPIHQFNEVPLVRRPLIDRGHIFNRPLNSIPDKEDRTQIQSFINIRPIRNLNNQFSHSYITHSPDITNKPWWIKSTTIAPKEKRTTTKRWWWTTTEIELSSTTSSPQRWSTNSWKPSKNNKRKWPVKTTVSSTSTITQQTLKNKDFCNPSTFKDAASSFDPEYELSSQRITGGRPLTPHSFPWLAMIMRGSKHVCGGSLIDESHILTAAHCVATLSSYQLSRLRILLGSHNIGKDEPTRQEYTIKTVIRHKDYSRKLLRNDLAIITLNESVKFTPEIRPICLYSNNDDLRDEYATVAGWGSLYEGGYQLYTPRVVDLRIWDNTECRATYGRAAPGGIVDSYLCAGKRGKDACSGDSGGPLMKKMGGVWMQVGVVSWGIGCGKGRYPGVYSRMSHFYPWIQRVVNSF